MLFKNFISFKVVQFSAFILLIIILVDFCRKFIKNKSFLYFFFIILFSTMPLVNAALLGGLIDIFTYLFGISSMLILLNIIINKKNHKNKILLSAIFLGFSISTKHLGLTFALLNFFLLIFIYFKKPWKKILNDIGLYAVIIFIIAGFWYIKNFIFTGNPLFPMFSNASPLFTKQTFDNAVGEYLITKNFINFFAFPFLFWGKNISKLPYAILNALYFALTYAMAIFLIIIKKIQMLEIILFALLEIYLLIIFYFSHQIRFAIPALILMTILFILLLDKIFHQRALKSYIAGLIIIASIILFAGSLKSLKTETLCLAGIKSENVCIAEKIGTMSYITNYINTNLTNETILEYWNHLEHFSLKKGNMYSEYFCEDKLNEDSLANSAIKECIEQKSISYLALNTKDKAIWEQYPDANNLKYKINIVDFFIHNGAIIYEIYDKKRDSYSRLYKL